MNTVSEVDEPINIWHVFWICLHNWCRNLNWIIIASSRTFHLRSLSLITFLVLCIPLHTIFSQDQICRLRYHFLTHMRCTRAQMGTDRQSMWSQGVTDTWILMNPLGSVSLCLPLHLIDSCTSSLPPSHTYTLAHDALGAPTVSDIMLLSSVVRRSHSLCLMLMSNSLSSDCVCVFVHRCRILFWMNKNDRWNTVTVQYIYKKQFTPYWVGWKEDDRKHMLHKYFLTDYYVHINNIFLYFSLCMESGALLSCQFRSCASVHRCSQ